MTGRGGGGAGRSRGEGSTFSEFEQIRREMERMFEETIHDIDRVPKDLVREYETPTGAKESIIIRQDFFNDSFPSPNVLFT